MTHAFKAIEDNAGGLHLFVFESDRCIYAAHGFEEGLGGLTDAIKSIADGSDPTNDWDGGDENPEASWAEHEAREERWPHGYKTVADEDGQYPDVMGRAARREFGLS
jgi:hypothetical protein